MLLMGSETPTTTNPGNAHSRSTPSAQTTMLSIGLRLADALALLTGALIANVLRFGTAYVDVHYYGVALLGVLGISAVFPAFNVYRRLDSKLHVQLFWVGMAWITTFACLLAVGYLIKITEQYSRGWSLIWFAAVAMCFAINRAFVRRILAHLHVRGINVSRCLLIGMTPAGARVTQATRQSPWLGLNLAGYLSTPHDQPHHHHDLGDMPHMGALEDLDDVLQQGHWDQIWIALPLSAQSTIDHLLRATQRSAAIVRFIPDMFGYNLINNRVESFAGTPVLTLRSGALNNHDWILKALEDRIIAFCILCGIAPLMLALAIGVKLSSPGPVLYRQRRVGLNGKEFEMLKFRSMPVDVEKDGIKWGNAGSKAVGRFGQFIRRTSLDELPQFLNVLKGDMSIVGPRPERPMFVHKFKHEIPGYMQKHLVKAGITGWAQINGWRGDTDLVQRIQCDLYYVNHWSVWLDIKIIFLTLIKGFVHKNAK